LRSAFSTRSPRIVVAGGTGFVGKALTERWPATRAAKLRLLIHRSRPAWVDRSAVEAVEVDLQDETSLARGFQGADVAINLLRPDGGGWFTAATAALIEAASAAGACRYIHVSTIDVYGSSPMRVLDEDAPIRPQSPYEREHAAAERLAHAVAGRIDVGIVRLGAVFGDGGRNLVTFANEARHAGLIRLALRRVLYGRRRMHLVSVETAADALNFVAAVDHALGGRVFLVVEDELPENNFAWLQDVMLDAFGRSRLDMLPSIPPAWLGAAMRIRGRSNSNPMRRFASRKLADIGFTPRVAFPERLRAYVAALAAHNRSD
jgi:nucleoside-diphosphate-sugar epimerase